MIVIDMDMPKNCSSCELSNINACPIFHRNAAESVKGRLNDCPIKCDIDDIKTEIERLHYHPKLDFIKNDEVVGMVLDIIDKYKAKSEE